MELEHKRSSDGDFYISLINLSFFERLAWFIFACGQLVRFAIASPENRCCAKWAKKYALHSCASYNNNNIIMLYYNIILVYYLIETSSIIFFKFVHLISQRKRKKSTPLQQLKWTLFMHRDAHNIRNISVLYFIFKIMVRIEVGFEWSKRLNF